MWIVRLWFTLSEPVNRRQYLFSGLFLMALKYAVDAALYFGATGSVWSPLAYINPLLSMRAGSGAPDWLLGAHAAVALPFLWIGVSMSVRRAVDAGWSAWVGTWFLVPIANFVAMTVLALRPSTLQRRASRANGPYRSMPPSERRTTLDRAWDALEATLISSAVGVASVLVSVSGFKSYGSGLFFVTPFMMGAIAAYICNRKHSCSVGQTLVVSSLSVLFSSAAILLFALEGFFCVLMAAPLALGAASFGALIGRCIAEHSNSRSFDANLLSALAVPVAVMAGAPTAPVEHSVTTSVEVPAPPERVWQQVIAFGELPQPDRLLFRTGVAYPLRASLTGEAVGAVRYCEFSTGAFVEPITHWEPPYRLAFSVKEQPPPMQEWSPFKSVTPLHLATALVSRRGEFRLIALPGQRTRLEGTTWYSLDIAPQAYFRIWSDAIIGAIHERVLTHIQHSSS